MAAKKKNALLLDYDAKSVATLKACRDYLTQAERFLNGQREELPDSSDIASAQFPLSTIREARYTGEDRFRLDWPFIAATINDLDKPTEIRSERYFDQWYFVVMNLMQLPGGRFLFDRSKGRAYYYVVYVGPHTKEGRHYLSRMIGNASPGADVRLSQDKDAHYDYRCIRLRTRSKHVVRNELGQETRARGKTREDGIAFAIELFERQLSGGEKVLGLDLSRPEYESLLRTAFDLADRMHEKLLAKRIAAHDQRGAAAE